MPSNQEINTALKTPELNRDLLKFQAQAARYALEAENWEMLDRVINDPWSVVDEVYEMATGEKSNVTLMKEALLLQMEGDIDGALGVLKNILIRNDLKSNLSEDGVVMTQEAVDRFTEAIKANK